MQCPKCKYEPTVSEIAASPDKCPSCGVYYAKVATRASASTEQSQDVKLSDWARGRPKTVLALAVLIAFVLGYFAGREHVKYEIRSTIQDAFSGFGRAFGGGEKPEPAPERKKSAPSVKAELVSKKLAEGDYSSAIEISVIFTNVSGSDIRAFDGNMVFTDILGNKIMDPRVVITEPLKAGANKAWTGEISFNKYSASDRKLASEKLENIRMEFSESKVLFSDGRSVEH